MDRLVVTNVLLVIADVLLLLIFLQGHGNLS